MCMSQWEIDLTSMVVSAHVIHRCLIIRVVGNSYTSLVSSSLSTVYIHSSCTISSTYLIQYTRSIHRSSGICSHMHDFQKRTIVQITCVFKLYTQDSYSVLRPNIFVSRLSMYTNLVYVYVWHTYLQYLFSRYFISSYFVHDPMNDKIIVLALQNQTLLDHLDT